MMEGVTWDPEPPSSARELERAVANARLALEEVTDEGHRARRSAALDEFGGYISLLRQAVPAPPTAEPRAVKPPRRENMFTLKLEFPDGRWDIDETPLGTAPRVGEFVDLGQRGRWQVKGSQVVLAAIKSRLEREFFVCTPAGRAA
jgi:hypothetical protein